MSAILILRFTSVQNMESNMPKNQFKTVLIYSRRLSLSKSPICADEQSLG